MGNAKPLATKLKRTYFAEEPKDAVKIATSNLFIDEEKVDADFAIGLFFEDISGNELINTQPYNFLVNTSNSNISNLNSIISNYTPQSLFRSSNSQFIYFNKFEIVLTDKIPLVGNGTNGSNIYFVSGGVNSICIEFINLSDDEEVEIEILSTSTPIGDTIV
jgi:hypothetical protein